MLPDKECSMSEGEADAAMSTRTPARLLSGEATRWDGEAKRHVLACEDGLGRDALASHIATVISRLPAPFTVAVYGGWGEGKTHLLKNVEEKVRQLTTSSAADGQGPKVFRTVWFDLWQHQDDVNPVLAMLALARDELEKDSGPLTALATKMPGWIMPALWTALDHLPTIGWGVDGGPKAEVSLASLGSDFKKHRDAHRQDRMEVLDLQARLHELFREALDHLAGDGRLVFFIDDLDRCLPEKVVDLLEKIRLFMNHERCVFVIGVDNKAVEQAIQHVKKYEDPQIAGRYLEKMIQYAFDLPVVEKSQRNHFVRESLANSLHDDADSLPIDAIINLWMPVFDDPEVDASIRLIERTVNTFVVDHLIGSSQLGQEYDARIMATISAIKACYREAFEKLRRRHDARLSTLWYCLFSFDNDAEIDDKRLGGLFCRSGDRWRSRGNPEGREPDIESRIGWGFIQATQGLSFSGNSDNTFSHRVEDHFRFAVSAESRTISDSPPLRVSVEPSSVDATPQVAAATDIYEDAGRPTERLKRLTGLVSYWTREPSTEEEVRDACAQIGEMDEAGHVVRLSGIDWRVLEVMPDGRALLIADHVIGTGPYNKAQVSVTWERCDLRRWLNEEFLKSLGGPLSSQIVRWKAQNAPNPTWGTDGGKDTVDQVFLLSMKDAADYFAGQEPSDWEDYQSRWFPLGKDGMATNEEGESAWWWLRSPGDIPDRAATVISTGSIFGSGSIVSVPTGGVRPALWINLERTLASSENETRK